MLRPGDVVVTMSYPGLFAVVEVVGDDVKIVDADGTIKTVLVANLRRVTRNESPES